MTDSFFLKQDALTAESLAAMMHEYGQWSVGR